MPKIRTRRFMAVVLVLSFIFSIILFSSKAFIVNAESTEESLKRVADTSTHTNWTNDFGQNVVDTSKSGRVWVDKSVFNDSVTLTPEDSQHQIATINRSDKNNFLVGLSAISSSKSIVGQDTIPIDVMFVLDVSGSMANRNTVKSLVDSTNSAIDQLLVLNPNNRIGVVLFSDNSTVLLPLGRYTTSQSQYIEYSEEWSLFFGYTYTISVNTNVKDENGKKVSGSKDVSGATYIQDGIYNGFTQLRDSANKEIDGTKKIPIMVLMGDGAPTESTTNYTNVGSSNIGDGTAASNAQSFVNQLTMSWIKNQMEQDYGREPLIYTLGLGLKSNDNYAKQVLDPSHNTSNDVENWWNTFDGLSVNSTMQLDNRRHSVTKADNTISNANRYYVDKYFPASDSNGLEDAFRQIIEEIYIQSLYYPTDVVGNGANLSGYLTFTDEIGDLMEVKKINGLVYDNQVFTGSNLAKFIKKIGGQNPGPGSRDYDYYNEIITSIASRLKISISTAETLIHNAYTSGQIYHNSDSDFNSSFKWYSNDNGDYLPNEHGATHINESFMISGQYKTEVGSGIQVNTDLMYITTCVTTDLTTGKQIIKFMIPASLIPQVKYKVIIEGNSLDQATTADTQRTGAYPMRLFYEVGSKATSDNIEFLAGKDNYPYYDAKTGTYTLYTNAWGTDESGNFAKTVATLDPSQENEFYYYHKNTPIYANKNGTLATGSKPSTGYYKNEVFSIGQNKIINRVYHEISKDALEKAEYDSEKGYWYIPKGTPKHQNLIKDVDKGENANLTNTADYISQPILTTNGQLNDYHIQVKLGNNGLTQIKQNRNDISVTKEVTGNRGEHEREFEFTVNLTDPNGTPLTGSYAYTKNNTPSESQIGNGSTITLKDKDVIAIQGLPVGAKFTITEQDPNTNGQAYNTTVTVDNQPQNNENPRTAIGDVVKESITSAKFINDWNVPEMPFSFTKVDGSSEDNTPLEGAQFRLFTLNCKNPNGGHNHSNEPIDPNDETDCWEPFGDTVTSASNGVVDFKNVPVGDYRLVEIKSPDGFQLPKGQWKINIDSTATKITIEATSNSTTPAFGQNTDGGYYIQNYKAIDPPITGGKGEFFFLLLGGLFILVGSGLLIYRKRLN